MEKDVKFELVNFGGAWCWILQVDGSYLVDPLFLDKFLMEIKKSG